MVKKVILCKYERELGEMHTNIKYIKQKVDKNEIRDKEILKEVSQNTDFRKKIVWMFAGVTLTFTFLINVGIWIIKYVKELFGK
jgi:hypothetical protein